MDTHTPTTAAELAKLGQKALRDRTYDGFHCGPPPLGYRARFHEKLRLHVIEPDPEIASTIRKMFTMRREGSSVRDIQRFAHQQGLRAKRGGKLSVSGIQHILTCITYKGLVRTPEGKIIAAFHEELDWPGRVEFFGSVAEARRSDVLWNALDRIRAQN